MELSSKKNLENLLSFFLGRQKCGWGSSVHMDAGKFFLENFWTSISGGEMIAFWRFLHLKILKMESSLNFFSKKPLNVFPWRMKMQLGDGARVQTKVQMEAIFWPFLNLHIWGSNGWILACFFFMHRYLNQKCIAKRICKQPSLIFFGGWSYGQGSWHPNGHWEFLFKFLNLHIWRRNNWPLMFSFSLLNIESGDVLQEINLEYLLSFFLGRRKCG
jgi:hypothetical protein